MPLATQDARRFSELRASGLLWLINRVVFHPRGLALAVHAYGNGELYGWSLLPSPDGGPWTYPEDVEPDYLRAAEATLTAALNTPVRPDEDVRPPSRPTPDEEAGRPGRDPVLGERPPTATSADAVRPGTDVRADDEADAGRTRDRRAEVRQAIDGAFLAPDEDGRPVRIIPAGKLTLGPDGLTDVERQRKTIRDTLNAELSHADAHAVWDLTLAISRALHAMPRYATPARPGLLDGPARCSCGATGELLAVDPAGLHAHAAPDEEQPHPAVAWWASAYERATVAEVRLSAVRDVLDDMERTTGARHWARLLRQAAGASHQDDYGGPEMWRRRAVRRALALSRAHGLINAVCDLAHEDTEEAAGEHGDGYRQALADLRAILVAFEHLPDEENPNAAIIVHSCKNPQARAFVEVGDDEIPIVHSAHRDEGAP
ncbi:hypothetical protein [Streptomyces sp. NBC_00443]|uniref:hypothetical protein n=1 Tax=Streptomyces sp. NBC_00443 TaxID=2975743 RepID=UPI002E23B96E